MSYLESDKSDLERKLLHQKSPGGGVGGEDQLDNRTRLPLLSSAGGGGGFGGETVVRLRILEQENERLLKKIRSMEAQLQVRRDTNSLDAFSGYS